MSILLLACDKKVSSTSAPASCSNRVSPTYSAALEESFCSPISYTGGITVTGNANYQPRVYVSNGLGGAGSSQPIRYAEVVVKDSSGSIIQCGATDSSGNFSLHVPSSTNSHTVEVRSRALSNDVKASVLNCPEENGYYKISKNFTPDGSKNIGNITATSSGEIISGAFNIFDKIVEANIFLRSKVSSCPYDNCANFTVAPKINAYWEKGYNPNNYFGSGSGVSFYIQGASRLFILGGINGDTNTSDTDHFDNSIIVHEYGHFIEDVFSDSDSPGGSHSGIYMIDPRLAWGEGWGNFFQAAVLDDPYYIDTYGNTDGSTGYIFKVPLEQKETACLTNQYISGCDVPTSPSEGQFREFAITRYLWDIHDDASESGDNIDGTVAGQGFTEIWAALVSNTGFKKTNMAFRDVGFLNDFQSNTLSGTSTPSDLSTLRTSTNLGTRHFQPSDRSEYAYYVDDNDSCGTFSYSITPINDMNDNGSFAKSNLLHNNNFYHFKHDGGTANIVLTYKTRTGGTQEADLDLYVYNNNYRYGVSSTVVGSSEGIFDNSTATDETETINQSLSSGDYLINVKIYTGQFTGSSCLGSLCPGNTLPTGNITDYHITVNGVRLCPTAHP